MEALPSVETPEGVASAHAEQDAHERARHDSPMEIVSDPKGFAVNDQTTKSRFNPSRGVQQACITSDECNPTLEANSPDAQTSLTGKQAAQTGQFDPQKAFHWCEFKVVANSLRTGVVGK